MVEKQEKIDGSYAKVNKKEILICSECGEPLYKCEQCDDYFKDNENITCCEGTHYHEGCVEPTGYQLIEDVE